MEMKANLIFCGKKLLGCYDTRLLESCAMYYESCRSYRMMMWCLIGRGEAELLKFENSKFLITLPISFFESGREGERDERGDDHVISIT